MDIRGPAARRKQAMGAQACFRGACAEDSVARWYEARGGVLLASRWRGTAGEIDLILRHRGVVVFCEVKSSKNRARAAGALSVRQRARLCQTASEYLATLPAGELTEMRFDVAIVGPDGRPQILHNAFGQT